MQKDKQTMDKIRKPIPYSQKKISKKIMKAAGSTEILDSEFNPNSEQTGISFNRSNKLSFRDDNTKQFTVGLSEINDAIFYYFNEIIKPVVTQNDERIPVPVIYNSPERWKSFQKDGYYRDKNGGIMLPIIAIGRESIVKDRTISNKLDANYPHLYTSSQKSYNAKEAYSNFNLLNNRTPSRQFNMTVIPSYVKIKYKCLIQTYYVEQLDKIIEAIEYASDSYWGEPNRFKFRAFIDEFSTSVELIAEQKRSAKSTFTLELRGYIIADNIQKDLTAIKKLNEKTKLNMNVIWNEQNAGTSTAASTERN